MLWRERQRRRADVARRMHTVRGSASGRCLIAACNAKSPPSCLHRAQQGAHPAPSLLAPRPHRRFASASTASPSAPPPCATTSSHAKHFPPHATAAPTTPSGCSLCARDWAVAHCWRRDPCCCALRPCSVSVPQADLTRTPSVAALRKVRARPPARACPVSLHNWKEVVVPHVARRAAGLKEWRRCA